MESAPRAGTARRILLAAILVDSFLILTIAGITATGAFYKPKTEIPPGFQGEYISIEGNPIRYLQVGRGPDILFLHGSPGSIEDWQPLVGELSQSFRLTLIDRPGHGWSGWQGARFTLEHNAQTVLSLIETLKLKNLLLVGHSYGSAAALAIAVKNPKNIRGYVLVGTAGFGPVTIPFIERIVALPYFGTGLARLIGPVIGPSMIRQGALRSLGPDASSVSEDFFDFRVRLWIQPKILHARTREHVQLEEDLAQINSHYGGIRAKVAMVQGKEDRSTHSAWQVHEAIPGSELTVFENAGHYVQFSRPRELARIIQKAARGS